MADDLLLAHDVVYRRPPLRDGALVVLNGCQTGVPDIRAVNESLGLMTAFLVRGASSVLSTQWCVEDLCAAEMSLKFVEEVRLKGTSPATALKAAQRYVREMTTLQASQRADDARQSLRSGSYDMAKADRILVRSGSLADRNEGAPGDVAEKDASMPVTEVGFRGIGVQSARPRVFNDPGFWGAFRLIGRVT
jgi:CHAT domain-containing protein